MVHISFDAANVYVLGMACLQPVFTAATGTSSSAAPTSLLGYNQANLVINENTDDMPFTLVPEQTDTAVIGAYLNFNGVANPNQFAVLRVEQIPALTQTSTLSSIQTSSHRLERTTALSQYSMAFRTFSFEAGSRQSWLVTTAEYGQHPCCDSDGWC